MELHDLTLEFGQLTDLDNIIDLHKKHLLSNLTEEQLKDGFIRVTYSVEDFKTIISDNAIVVAKNNNKIIGYYLLGHSSNSTTLQYQFDALNKYSINNTKLSDLKVACGAQAVLEKEFRGNGLTEKMLQKLIEQVKMKYSFLFSSITKYNSNAFKVHKNSGYIIVGEDESKYFVCLKLNDK